MSLRLDLAEHLLTSPPHLSIKAAGHQWDIHVLGISRIGNDSFLQMALVGPRVCTVTARVPAAYEPDAKARAVIALVLQWLSSEPVATQAFLETPDCLSATA